MKCSVCGGKIGLFVSIKTSDGERICGKCNSKIGFGLAGWDIRKMSLGEVKYWINEYDTSNSLQGTGTNFNPTIVIGNNLMLIDENNKKVQFPKLSKMDTYRRFLMMPAGNTAIYNIGLI